MTCPLCEAVADTAVQALRQATVIMEKLVDGAPVDEADWQRLHIHTARIGELSRALETDDVQR